MANNKTQPKVIDLMGTPHLNTNSVFNIQIGSCIYPAESIYLREPDVLNDAEQVVLVLPQDIAENLGNCKYCPLKNRETH